MHVLAYPGISTLVLIMQAIMEVETTMILETTTSSHPIMVQWRVEILVAAGTWGDHMVEVLFVSWPAFEPNRVGQALALWGGGREDWYKNS